MLKLTLKPGSGFNVTYNNEPMELHNLKLSPDTFSDIDEILRSLKEPGCTECVSSLEYSGGTMVFHKRIANKDTTVYLPKFPVGALRYYLKEMESTILRLSFKDTSTT